MTIRKRGNVWWMDISISANGKTERILRSTKSTDRQQAQEIHDKARADLWRLMMLGEKVERTWSDAVKLYRTEKRHLKSLESSIRVNIDWLNRRIPADAKLSAVADMIPDLRTQRIEQLTPKGTVPKQATINAPLACLSAILNLAEKRGYMKHAPHVGVPNPRNKRTRWIAKEVAYNLLLPEARRRYGTEFADLVEFSLLTGLRQDNATRLRPEWVSVATRTITIPETKFKGGRDFTLPLSDRAFQLVIKGISRRLPFVFATGKGTACAKPNEQLKECCKAVGIDDFHWHDLRHTFATWHVRAGTPLEILQRLGGWQDHQTVLRYAAFAPDHVAAHANAIERGGDIQAARLAVKNSDTIAQHHVANVNSFNNMEAISNGS